MRVEGSGCSGAASVRTKRVPLQLQTRRLSLFDRERMCVCVRVCMCQTERGGERKREGEGGREGERERGGERGREGGREGERERERDRKRERERAREREGERESSTGVALELEARGFGNISSSTLAGLDSR